MLALSLILEGFDGSYAENEDVPEAPDDSDYIVVPFGQSDVSKV